ncbi:DNA adenine modification methylase [Marinobacter shengliensis]|uniref:DNA adenine modification methylase n=1 Tax=Marinobacter shengliensis TaxID=1389223 RepID=UPI001107B5F4|nr:DNA adenine modification methylase [Marinobacter shengliensis]
MSFPSRGKWGNSRWRGNCSGHMVRGALGSYLDWNNPNALFVDPSEGGGTSRDVANELGVNYVGLDLHSGFNLLKDDLLESVGQPSNMVFWHPPYHSMIEYSRNVWGDGQPHPDDLSNCQSVAEFIEKSQLAMMNIYESLSQQGRSTYCVLIGNMRKAGQFYDLTGMLQRVAPGKLRDIIIKQQHNCVSDSRRYGGGAFARIAHETLLVFERDTRILCAIDFACQVERRLENAQRMTWRTALKRVTRPGERVHLRDLYGRLEGYARRLGTNNDFEAKIRQVVRRYAEDFVALDGGFYERTAA